MTLAKILLTSLVAAASAFAHCDSLDGPVVQAARRALAAGDVNYVLPWVRAGGEAEIRDSFRRALAVRKLSPDAANMADTWFFETLVRVHRAGEGAPFEGLKPSGTYANGPLAAADKAIESGELKGLDAELAAALRDGLRRRFERVVALRNYAPADVNRGREYVAAYVDFIHFAERLHDTGAAAEPAGGHQH